jgi:hypothetical protein
VNVGHRAVESTLCSTHSSPQWHRHRTTALALAFFAATANTAAAKAPVLPPVPENITARVRVLEASRAQISLWPNRTCYGGDTAEEPAIRSYSNSPFALLRKQRPILIGMPPSYRSTHWGKNSVNREYAVPAGVPLTIRFAYHSGNSVVLYYCNDQAFQFTPVAGKNYEVYLNTGDGMCRPDIIVLPDKSTELDHGTRLPVTPDERAAFTEVGFPIPQPAAKCPAIVAVSPPRKAD